MRTFSRRKLEAARRSLVFSHDHPDPNPAAAPSVHRLEQLLALVVVLMETLCRCQREVVEARGMREGHLQDLRCHLAALARFAAAVAARENVAELVLRLPRETRTSRIAWFVWVRQVIAAARRHEDLLMHYGLPGTLLGDLEADLLHYELAERRRAEGEAEGAQATAILTDLANEAHQLIRHLDALNRLRFADDPEAAAAWRAASAVRWNRPQEIGAMG